MAHTTTSVDQKSFDSSIKKISHPLKNNMDLDRLLEEIGEAHYVLLGEASHGTHEYYTWRMEITKRLIEEKDFSFIAVEGDWPDCYAVNRFVKGYDDVAFTAEEVLRRFERWPSWMWANWEVVALAEWLKKHNAEQSREKRVGFYGLDVYSLGESLEAIIAYLDREDPEAAKTARKVIACFDIYGGSEGQEYAMATRMVPQSCEDEVIQMLSKITDRIERYNTDPEMVFSTNQNANIAVNAERYYRAMVGSGPDSWNIRDRHMADTLDRLMDFHERGAAKCILWEHNTHIGDARATSMARNGMVNVGQLVREKQRPNDVVLVGFGSYKGSVIAGSSWGDPMQKMTVPEAREGSWEALLHNMDAQDQLLIFDDENMSGPLSERFDHRAIGVVYHPGTDYISNYVPSIMPQRYDAFLYIDETEGVHPLHMKPHKDQIPETYPWGF